MSPHGAGPAALALDPCPRRPAPPGLTQQLPAAGWIDGLDRPRPWIGKPVRFGRLDRLTQIALVAAHHAVAGDTLPSDRQRAGIVFGTALGSHLTNETFLRQMEQLGPAEASPALFTYTLPSAAVGETSIHFGLQGPTVTLAQGTGAGIAALDLAANMVRRGEASWMLAGAADVLGPTLIAAMGPDAGDLAEGAAFFVVRPARRTNGGLARIGAAEQGRQEAQQLEEAALGRVAVVRRQLQAHLVYRADAEHPLQTRLGRSLSAAPLLGIAALLAGEALEAPVLITVQDDQGLIDVLCLTPP